MITEGASHLSLVPFNPERRAVMEAIAEVELRQSRGAVFTSYPYASAFFRILNGSKRVTTKDIAWFSPGLTAQALREKNRSCWRQSELNDEKYSRQRRREACQREMEYQALAGQAEIELTFHTPETVSRWRSRWSGTELRQYDLEDMFWRWSERFPDRKNFCLLPFPSSLRRCSFALAARELTERWIYHQTRGKAG
ncbi:plasmid SOS inhibition protein A [Citrobacter freundii]|nr:plasmid SOS inhibition protein A [Citrobacter freundii]